MEYHFPDQFHNQNCFFAAANSYSGFKNNFDNVFSYQDFDKIYILKGGPGTGKSRFIQSIGNVLHDRGCQTDWYFCSSDPYSLDGVILRETMHKVGIVDGTSPHARDASVPGAIEVLVDLGNGWSETALEEKKEELRFLKSKNKAMYVRAYEYLSICKNYNIKSEAEIEKIVKEAKLQAIAKAWIASLNLHNSGKEKVCYTGAFCKFGELSLPTFFDKAKKIFTLDCDDGLQVFAMRLFLEELRASDYKFIRCMSPLDESDTQAIYIPEAETLLVCKRFATGEETEDICLSGCFDAPTPSLRFYREIHAEELQKAQSCLALAQEAHNSMESIYKASMDFTYNDKCIHEYIDKISRVLL